MVSTWKQHLIVILALISKPAFNFKSPGLFQTFIYAFIPLWFLANNTAAIMYLTDSEDYGRDSVARQYFMQLAQYVKLPMISWNADNSAFEMGSLQVKPLYIR